MKFSLRLSSITGRLGLLLAVVAMVACTGAMVIWNSLQEVNDLARRTETVRVKQLEQMAMLELSVTRVSLQLRHAMLARTPAERQAALDDIVAKRRLIDETTKAYAELLYTPEGKKRFEPLPGLMQTFWKSGEANLAKIQAGRMDEAFAHLVDEMIPARNAALKVMEETVQYQERTLQREIATMSAGVTSSRWIAAGVFGLLVAAMAGFAGWLSGTLHRRVQLSQAVAERVRDGDLTGDVAVGERDEFAPLLQALAQMQDALRRVVSGVRQSADSVASASGELAHGNQNLSARTEQQAGALQVTASTMEHLGETVRRNAESAQQANTLAGEAARVAQDGGAVVGQVVETMQGIAESSRRIADIIGTIDGIAFQTNILALNAAVEAARAGEQGRGFAVVAGEVRNLAQRSADAAREIKGLIQVSVERVEAGSGLVHEAGRTMGGIVDAIDRVNAIVREISEASQAQSNGIGQVGVAIEEMDRGTQQNAALVEQSAAAADSMRQQAQHLVQAVAGFRLREPAL